VEEVCQGGGAVANADVGPQMSPLVEQGAVEAFDLAVGLRPVGAGVLAGRGEVFQGPPPGVAFAVGPCVVRQDVFRTVDAEGGEEGRGPAREGGAGGGFLVPVDLAGGRRLWSSTVEWR
jgi:hypothetical protein